MHDWEIGSFDFPRFLFWGEGAEPAEKIGVYIDHFRNRESLKMIDLQPVVSGLFPSL